MASQIHKACATVSSIERGTEYLMLKDECLLHLRRIGTRYMHTSVKILFMRIFFMHCVYYIRFSYARATVSTRCYFFIEPVVTIVIQLLYMCIDWSSTGKVHCPYFRHPHPYFGQTVQFCSIRHRGQLTCQHKKQVSKIYTDAIIHFSALIVQIFFTVMMKKLITKIGERNIA